MVNTEAIIRHALQENIEITLVINKVDRLILELRIKPADAYYKIRHTIEAFASTDMAWCFTLRSFAQMYGDTYGECDVKTVAINQAKGFERINACRRLCRSFMG